MEEKGPEKREILPDIVKGIAIIMVVWGHAIQYWHGVSYDFWSDPIFIFIYTFHMPLFALISGYFAFKSIAYTSLNLLVRSRSYSMIMPYIYWGLVVRAIMILPQLLSGNMGLREYLISCIRGMISSPMWFLVAVWVATILIALVERWATYKNKLCYLIYTAIGLGVMFIPKISNSDTIGFVLPFFFLGALYGKQKRTIEKLPTIWLVAVIISYVVLLHMWNKEAYVYISGISLFSKKEPVVQLARNIYRFVIGLLGSLSVIGILHIVNQNRIIKSLSKFGESSGNIYIISTIGFIFSSKILSYIKYNWIPSSFPSIIISILLFPISIVFVYLCMRLGIQIQRSKLLALLMLGKRKTK